MKSFFKDYWELCKESNKWMKKHWKGYLVYRELKYNRAKETKRRADHRKRNAATTRVTAFFLVCRAWH